MCHRYSRLALAVLFTAGPVSGIAETGAGNDTKATNSSSQYIEEITVTGRPAFVDNQSATIGALGNKDASEIPLAISSYGSVLIQNQQLRTLTEISKNDSSIQDAAFNASYSNVSIRGYITDWTNSLKRNNLPLAPYQDIPIEGIEQVAILKGPSGFLYGLTPPGGTVNYISKRPTRDSFTSLTIGGGSFGRWYVAGDASRRINDNVAVRVNAGHERQGDDFDKKDDFERSFVTAAVDWVINDQAVLQINGDFQNKKVAAHTPLGTRNGLLPPLNDPRTLIGLPWLNYETDVYNLNPRLDYNINDNWSFTIQAGYSSNTRFTAFPGVGSVDPATGDIISADSRTRIRISPDQTYRSLSGEAFMTGNFNTGGISHELVIGASGVRYRAKESGYFIIPDLPIGNIFTPDYSFPEPALPDPLPTKTHNDVDQDGPFFSDMISLSEQVQLLLGGRHVTFDNTQSRAGAVLKEFNRKKFVPNVGLIYRPTQDVMFYANWTKGIEQSNVAPPSANNAGEQFGPLESDSYEIGAKASVTDDISVTLSLFEITKSLEFINLAGDFGQDGEQQHRGIELSANGRILDNLHFIAGATYLDTEQLNLADVDVIGKRSPNVPEFQANLYLDYQVQAVEGLNLTASIYHNGDKAVNAANTLFIPSYTTGEVGARYATKLGDKHIVYRATIRNITDKDYWAAAQSGQVMISQPRTFMLSAQIEL